MDPLTALSVAGTIIQFVDFGNKLLMSSFQLYKLPRGMLKANEELELVTGDLQSVVVKLRGACPEDDESLRDFHAVCNEAAHIANELLERLIDLKVRNGRSHAWESLKAAVKAAWSKDEIESLKERLSTLKEAFNSRTMLLLW
jgi:hypothetical protein